MESAFRREIAVAQVVLLIAASPPWFLISCCYNITNIICFYEILNNRT
jgi:hypothetical protein